MAAADDKHEGNGTETDDQTATISSTIDTDTEKHHEDGVHITPDRTKEAEAANAPGHDADVPSLTGGVLDEQGELQQQRSITDQKGLPVSKSQSHTSRVSDLEKGESSKSNKKTDNDPNIVWWDGDDDPENPYNWPRWKRISLCVLISFYTLLTPLASSMFAPGVPGLMEGFRDDSKDLASFVVSVYILGFAFGPLIMAPMSEIYGRTIVYHVCNIGFVAFLVACALAPTLNTLIVFRFFSGIFGSCPLTNGGGTISDMIRQEKRAAAMSAFSVGPLLGPIIGPVAGGFLAAAKGWRWVFWVLAITAGVVTMAMLALLSETYAPVILQRKVDKLRKETGNPLLRSKLDMGLSTSDYFKRGIVRPMRMLTRSPIVAIFALYMGVVYGYLYLMFTSITQVFEEFYGFSTQTAGLVFLGLGIGSMGGLAVFSFTSDKYLKKMSEKEGQGMKPEYRLQPLPIGAILLPVGFFLYGWTANYHVFWIVPIIGTAIIGVANLIIFMALQMYLVDAFTAYAASALASNTVVRSVMGAVLPLAGLPMYSALGIGWGNSLLGFIAIAMLPVPYFILKKGEWLRTRFELKNL